MYQLTEKEKQVLEQIFGAWSWEEIEKERRLYEESGFVRFTCIGCGKKGNYEYLVERVPTIVCSDCGEVYYKASTIKLLEQRSNT